MNVWITVVELAIGDQKLNDVHIRWMLGEDCVVAGDFRLRLSLATTGR